MKAGIIRLEIAKDKLSSIGLSMYRLSCDKDEVELDIEDQKVRDIPGLWLGSVSSYLTCKMQKSFKNTLSPPFFVF